MIFASSYDQWGFPEGECLQGRMEYTSPDGKIHVLLDTPEFCWYMEASPDAQPSHIATALDRVVIAGGFELADEHECPPEINSQGWTRIWLQPLVAIDDMTGPIEQHGLLDAGRARLAMIAAVALVTPAVRTLLEVFAA